MSQDHNITRRDTLKQGGLALLLLAAAGSEIFLLESCDQKRRQEDKAEREALTAEFNNSRKGYDVSGVLRTKKYTPNPGLLAPPGGSLELWLETERNIQRVQLDDRFNFDHLGKYDALLREGDRVRVSVTEYTQNGKVEYSLKLAEINGKKLQG